MERKTSTERVRLHRKRKRQQMIEHIVAKKPRTVSERVRLHRVRVHRRVEPDAESGDRSDDDRDLVEAAVDFGDPYVAGVKTRIDQLRREYVTFRKFEEFMSAKFFSDNLQDFCRVCDHIWWTSNSRLLTSVKNTLVGETLRKHGYDTSSVLFRLCSMCYGSLQKGHLPILSTVNGFRYPPVPPNLPELNPIELRLIALRISFMQIRDIRYFAGSAKLIGQVINVPMNVMKTLNALPRGLDDDATFNVCLKKNLAHRSSELVGCISKRNIKTWIKYLLNTPLYQQNNVTLNNSFLDNQPDTDEEDDSVHEFERQESEYARRFVTVTRKREKTCNSEEFLSMYQETLFWPEDMILNLAPAAGERPLSLAFDEYAEEMSFPQIYYGERRSFTRRVTPFAIAASEIRHRDRRGVQGNKILYTAAKILRLRCIASLNTMFRTKISQGARITREDLEDPAFVKSMMDKNESFLRALPNSVQFWTSKKHDLFAMMRQLGKPTLFMTVSASEIHWPQLLRYAYRFQYCDTDSLPNNLTNDEFVDLPSTVRAQLINDDPILCCLYFKRFVDTLIMALKKTNGPFGSHRVVDYFLRFEFQHRGSPHCHMLLWLDNMPSLPDDLNEEVDLYETIGILDTLMIADADKLTSMRPLQTHNHTHTCYKKHNKQCRFGIPYWPMDKTRILCPVSTENRDEALIAMYKQMHADLEKNRYESMEDFLGQHMIVDMDDYIKILRHGISGPKIFLRRTLDDIWTGPFNRDVSAVLQSNMDIQFILDGYGCAAYVAEYINKSERGFSSLHRALIKIREEYPELDYDGCLRRLGIEVLNKVELCVQEAAWILLRLPMSEMSRKVRFIPTEHPSERILVRKHREQMNRERLSGTSTNVWLTNVIQRYEARSAEFEDLHLAYFIANYVEKIADYEVDHEDDLLEQEPGEDVEYDETAPTSAQETVIWKRRTHEIIIKWVGYKNAVDELNYMRELVTLFIPFRNEELDLLDRDRYIALYRENIQLIMERLRRYDCGLSEEKLQQLLREAAEREAVIEGVVVEDESIETPGPRVTTVEDPHIAQTTLRPNNDDIVVGLQRSVVRRVENVLSHRDYCESIRRLNDGQKTIVLEFLNRLLYDSDEPLQVFLTGPAGAGKTTLLLSLMETCNRFTQRHSVSKNAYVACATTGKAAVNLAANTVHVTFNISVNPSRRSLTGQATQSMRCDFAELSLIIIDEVSMASCQMLNCINERLMSVGPDRTKPFGGFHIIVCGDLRQLPPVMAKPIYARPPYIL